MRPLLYCVALLATALAGVFAAPGIAHVLSSPAAYTHVANATSVGSECDDGLSRDRPISQHRGFHHHCQPGLSTPRTVIANTLPVRAIPPSPTVGPALPSRSMPPPHKPPLVG